MCENRECTTGRAVTFHNQDKVYTQKACCGGLTAAVLRVESALYGYKKEERWGKYHLSVLSLGIILTD